MKISYHKETDSLYIYLNNEKVADTIVINDDANVDVDSEGNIVGIEIYQNASKHADMESLETVSFPVQNIKVGKS